MVSLSSFAFSCRSKLCWLSIRSVSRIISCVLKKLTAADNALVVCAALRLVSP